ncbi:MAG: SUMF1/EgtB/PvdO family nonheme iron enzyme [Anaerolineae bacterium]|nr:SUMF1/EgtB/PvdO family nonheme iron enzyme [Anaerolineae bacterium]
MSNNPASPKVFISYRRADTQHIAGRINDIMEKKLGAETVFQDVEDLHPGIVWKDALSKAVADCEVMLVVIGKQWLNIADERDGSRRLDNPEDWVRFEVETALRLPQIRVIPVLVNGASLPSQQELPAALMRLTEHQIFELRDGASFKRDVEALIDGLGINPLPHDLVTPPPMDLRPSPPLATGGRFPGTWVITAVITLMLVIAVGVLLNNNRPRVNGSSPTALATTATATITVSPTVVIQPTSIAVNPLNPRQRVGSNSAWQPFSHVVSGVEMMLVPAGCFMMGSVAANDEAPVTSECIDQPYWIDRTEVTNQTYGSAGVFSGNNVPRDSVSWLDAYAHCQGRGGRLPDEREWEYAARGPDSHKYPWGNVMESSYLSYYPEYTGQYPIGGSPMPVGSYPSGASWVGALDMSGNVWEWVNSRYSYDVNGRNPRLYPYDPDDGREQYSTAGDTPWGLRGGSWGVDAKRVTTHWRNFSSAMPDNRAYGIGFRCIRDYQDGDLP